VHPDVRLNGQQLRLEQFPKILGLRLDPTLSMSHHAKARVKLVNKRTNVLKALAGTTWGQDTETLTTAYRAIGKTCLEYPAPVITPLLSTSSWKKLQVAQNSALRLVTGCVNMTSIDHLHEETKVLPVQTHCQMLAKQYIHKALLRQHPCHLLLRSPPPPRLMKPTLTDIHRQHIDSLLPTNPSLHDVQALNAETHRQTVLDTITSFAPNRVLNARPPSVNTRQLESTANLSRRARTFLAQLRSGFSPILYSFRARVPSSFPNATNLCPNCGIGPHDTNHLFNCPSRPTSLEPSDLWTQPAEVAAFLQLSSPIDDSDIPWDPG